MWSLEVVEMTSLPTLTQKIVGCRAQAGSPTHLLSSWLDQLQLVGQAVQSQWESQWVGFIDCCHLPLLSIAEVFTAEAFCLD